MSKTTDRSLKTAVRPLSQTTSEKQSDHQAAQTDPSFEISLNRKTCEQMASALADSDRNLPEGMIAFLCSGALVHLFEGVPDFQDEDKVQYELPVLLALLFLAIVTGGECRFQSIADESCYRQNSFYEDLGLIQIKSLSSTKGDGR